MIYKADLLRRGAAWTGRTQYLKHVIDQTSNPTTIYSYQLLIFKEIESVLSFNIFLRLWMKHLFGNTTLCCRERYDLVYLSPGDTEVCLICNIRRMWMYASHIRPPVSDISSRHTPLDTLFFFHIMCLHLTLSLQSYRIGIFSRRFEWWMRRQIEGA